MRAADPDGHGLMLAFFFERFAHSEDARMSQAATATGEDVITAERAAADAAVEARREVVEDSSGAALPRRPTSTERARSQAAVKPQWHRFVVDVWLTDLNPTEFGIYKRSRNKAKSRQFTSDMDIFAEVIEGGERTGLIGYREDQWTKAAGLDKRLVFKLFSEGLHWRATMDLMLGRSVQQTLGARGLPVMTYSINTNDHDQVVYVERSANKWPLMPENFSFFLMNEGVVEFFRIRQDLVSIGQDYTVLNERNEVVAHLDGALFTLGGYWKCRVRSDYKDRRLHTVVKMFAAMLCFNRSCRRHLKRVARDIRAGRYHPKLERFEADLYMNPRRVR
jgi:hypothetical protein